MMAKRMKKMISLILALTMCLGLVNMTASATWTKGHIHLQSVPNGTYSAITVYFTEAAEMPTAELTAPSGNNSSSGYGEWTKNGSSWYTREGDDAYKLVDYIQLVKKDNTVEYRKAASAHCNDRTGVDLTLGDTTTPLIPVVVEIYVDGELNTTKTDAFTAQAVGATVTVSADQITAFTPAGTTYDADNVNKVTSGTVPSSGTLVLKLYYVTPVTYQYTYYFQDTGSTEGIHIGYSINGGSISDLNMEETPTETTGRMVTMQTNSDRGNAIMFFVKADGDYEPISNPDTSRWSSNQARVIVSIDSNRVPTSMQDHNFSSAIAAARTAGYTHVWWYSDFSNADTDNNRNYEGISNKRTFIFTTQAHLGDLEITKEVTGLTELPSDYSVTITYGTGAGQFVTFALSDFTWDATNEKFVAKKTVEGLFARVYTLSETVPTVANYSRSTTFDQADVDGNTDGFQIEVKGQEKTSVTVKNAYTAQLGTLSIGKLFDGAFATAPEGFTATFTLYQGSVAAENVVGQVHYKGTTVGNVTTYGFGDDATESYLFTDLFPGEYFLVETGADVDTYTLVTSYKVGERAANQTGAVTIGANENLAMTVTNTYTDATDPTATITKVADKATYETTETVTYTITVKNVGRKNVTITEVKDTLPKELTLATGTTSGYTTSGNADGSVDITWIYTTPVVLAPGEERVITVKATADTAGDTITNVATATHDDKTIEASADITVSDKVYPYTVQYDYWLSTNGAAHTDAGDSAAVSFNTTSTTAPTKAEVFALALENVANSGVTLNYNGHTYAKQQNTDANIEADVSSTGTLAGGDLTYVVNVYASNWTKGTLTIEKRVLGLTPAAMEYLETNLVFSMFDPDGQQIDINGDAEGMTVSLADFDCTERNELDAWYTYTLPVELDIGVGYTVKESGTAPDGYTWDNETTATVGYHVIIAGGGDATVCRITNNYTSLRYAIVFDSDDFGTMMNDGKAANGVYENTWTLADNVYSWSGTGGTSNSPVDIRNIAYYFTQTNLESNALSALGAPTVTGTLDNYTWTQAFYAVKADGTVDTTTAYTDLAAAMTLMADNAYATVVSGVRTLTFRAAYTLTYNYSDFGSSHVTMAYWIDNGASTTLSPVNYTGSSDTNRVLAASQTVASAAEHDTVYVFVKADAGYSLRDGWLNAEYGSSPYTPDSNPVGTAITENYDNVPAALQSAVAAGDYTHFFRYTSGDTDYLNRYFKATATANGSGNVIIRYFIEGDVNQSNPIKTEITYSGLIGAPVNQHFTEGNAPFTIGFKGLRYSMNAASLIAVLNSLGEYAAIDGTFTETTQYIDLYYTLDTQEVVLRKTITSAGNSTLGTGYTVSIVVNYVNGSDTLFTLTNTDGTARWTIDLPILDTDASYTITERNFTILGFTHNGLRAQYMNLDEIWDDLTVNGLVATLATNDVAEVLLTNSYTQDPTPPELPPDTPPRGDDEPGGDPGDVPEDEEEGETIPEEPLPGAGAPEEPEEVIEQAEPPMAEAPETGDNAGLWMALAAISGLGLAWMGLSGKKREDEEA